MYSRLSRIFGFIITGLFQIPARPCPAPVRIAVMDRRRPD